MKAISSTVRMAYHAVDTFSTNQKQYEAVPYSSLCHMTRSRELHWRNEDCMFSSQSIADLNVVDVLSNIRRPCVVIRNHTIVHCELGITTVLSGQRHI